VRAGLQRQRIFPLAAFDGVGSGETGLSAFGIVQISDRRQSLDGVDVVKLGLGAALSPICR